MYICAIDFDLFLNTWMFLYAILKFWLDVGIIFQMVLNSSKKKKSIFLFLLWSSSWTQSLFFWLINLHYLPIKNNNKKNICAIVLVCVVYLSFLKLIAGRMQGFAAENKRWLAQKANCCKYSYWILILILIIYYYILAWLGTCMRTLCIFVCLLLHPKFLEVIE